MSNYITVAVIAFIAGLLAGGALYRISDRKDIALKLNNTLICSLFHLIKAGIITKEQSEPIENSFREEIKKNFDEIELDTPTKK